MNRPPFKCPRISLTNGNPKKEYTASTSERGSVENWKPVEPPTQLALPVGTVFTQYPYQKRQWTREAVRSLDILSVSLLGR